MFPRTQPLDAPSEPPPSVPMVLPRRVSHGGDGGPDSVTQLSELSASLMQDLLRFERRNDPHEMLEVLAACMRHTQAVAIRVAYNQQAITLTIFPLDGLVHCPMPMFELMTGDLSSLRVLQVAPAALRPPGNPELARVGNPAFYTPLSPLLWAVALYGTRGTLLPELAGPAAYRVAPGLDLTRMPIPAAMGRCIERLRRRSYNLREISEWFGIGRDRATRLLNALYLQSGLIVSRTHPSAATEGWSPFDRE